MTLVDLCNVGLFQSTNFWILSVDIGCAVAIQRTAHLVGCSGGFDVKRNAFCQAGCTHTCARAHCCLSNLSSRVIYNFVSFRLFFLDAQLVVLLLFYIAMNFEVISQGLPKWSASVMLGYFLMREFLTSVFHSTNAISIIIITSFFVLKLIPNCFPPRI